MFIVLVFVSICGAQAAQQGFPARPVISLQGVTDELAKIKTEIESLKNKQKAPKSQEKIRALQTQQTQEERLRADLAQEIEELERNWLHAVSELEKKQLTAVPVKQIIEQKKKKWYQSLGSWFRTQKKNELTTTLSKNPVLEQPEIRKLHQQLNQLINKIEAKKTEVAQYDTSITKRRQEIANKETAQRSKSLQRQETLTKALQNWNAKNSMKQNLESEQRKNSRPAPPPSSLTKSSISQPLTFEQNNPAYRKYINREVLKRANAELESTEVINLSKPNKKGYNVQFSNEKQIFKVPTIQGTIKQADKAVKAAEDRLGREKTESAKLEVEAARATAESMKMSADRQASKEDKKAAIKKAMLAEHAASDHLRG